MIKIYSIFFWIIYGIITIILGAFIFLSSIFFDDRFLHKIGKIWGKIALILTFTKVNYLELSDFDKNDSYIIMPNHQSAFDIFALFAYLPLEFRWVSKKENFKIPVVGHAMKVMKEISVDRGNIKELKSTIEAMKKCLDRKISVLIFPEGTRSKDGKLLPFKKGGFFLAVNSNKKILPVAIWGTKDINERGSLLIHPFKKVKILIGEPVDLNYKGKIDDKMKRFRDILTELIDKAKNS